MIKGQVQIYLSSEHVSAVMLFQSNFLFLFINQIAVLERFHLLFFFPWFSVYFAYNSDNQIVY